MTAAQALVFYWRESSTKVISLRGKGGGRYKGKNLGPITKFNVDFSIFLSICNLVVFRNSICTILEKNWVFF